MKEPKVRCWVCKEPSADKYHRGCMVRLNRRARRGRPVNIPADAVIEAILSGDDRKEQPQEVVA